MAKTLYVHRRKDNNEVFYVGIGNEKRPYRKQSRNQFWHNVVDKYGYYVQILKDNLNNNDAMELEELLISEYGRRDLGEGNLVNLTNGGDGCLVVSGITKKKISKSNKGRDAWNKGMRNIYSKETLKKMSDSQKGKQSPRKGVKLSKETKDKIRQHNLGKKLSEETKNKISKANKGHKNSAARRVLDTETGVVYKTVKDAAISLGVGYTTLCAWLNGYVKNKSNLIKI
jgi:hypothetical protein